MSSVLVTGATGFIGRALCEGLVRRGHLPTRLSSRDGDIADPVTLNQVSPANHVFHLAGLTFVPDSWHDPHGFHRVNVLGTINVLEFCRRHSAGITFVSAYIYGQPEWLPVSEACVPKPNNPYALSKYVAEQACEFYSLYYGVDATIIRPFNVFGPAQSERFLIPHILSQVRDRRAIHVKDLAPKRDYVYLHDLVDALISTLDRPTGFDVFNVGSGTSVSVGDLIALIQSIAGTDLPVVCEDQVRPNELADVYANTAKAHDRLAWRPRYSLKRGLEETISAGRAAS